MSAIIFLIVFLFLLFLISRYEIFYYQLISNLRNEKLILSIESTLFFFYKLITIGTNIFFKKVLD